MRPRTPVSVACLALALLASSAPMARARSQLRWPLSSSSPGRASLRCLWSSRRIRRFWMRGPPTLELFDRWPKDSIQRFYFRALAPGDATLRFHGQAGELTLLAEGDALERGAPTAPVEQDRLPTHLADGRAGLARAQDSPDPPLAGRDRGDQGRRKA